MATKGKREREKRIARTIAKYQDKRQELLSIINSPNSSDEEYHEAKRKFNRIPRSASPTRARNRCRLTGRSRGYLRKFGMSRIKFRELALQGEIPGVTKASW